MFRKKGHPPLSAACLKWDACTSSLNSALSHFAGPAWPSIGDGIGTFPINAPFCGPQAMYPHPLTFWSLYQRKFWYSYTIRVLRTACTIKILFTAYTIKILGTACTIAILHTAYTFKVLGTACTIKILRTSYTIKILGRACTIRILYTAKHCTLHSCLL